MEKDRTRKRLQDKKKPKPEQDAFKAAERVRVQKYRQKKKEQAAANVTLPDKSPFQSRQSTGKAMKRAKTFTKLAKKKDVRHC